MDELVSRVENLGGVLSREQLHALIEGADRPLVIEWQDLEAQLQPNGIDLTLREVSAYRGAGQIGVSSEDRILPELEPLAFDAEGWVTLQPGIYQIMYNEIVDIPVTLMALGRPRSSLGRGGATIHTAVWDAGYRGRSTSMLAVVNPEGFRLQRNARVMQLVFFGMAQAPADGYRGKYQNENVAQ
ncbi:MAG TPA: deoxyuridine 5'-triphosphate nucleotidohydrolase [Thermomicrobiales bacterium]|nr:deoxyuridine 5'-triphosphate nucleotidohydrolase [Thermomicrobiales bacterium]